MARRAATKLLMSRPFGPKRLLCTKRCRYQETHIQSNVPNEAITTGAGLVSLYERTLPVCQGREGRRGGSEGEPLQFEPGPVELEATMAVEKGGGANAKVRFWVIELGGVRQSNSFGHPVDPARLTATCSWLQREPHGGR